MKCVVCRNGETKPGLITFTLERDGAILVVRGVPGRVCENCGEEYIEDSEVARLGELADETAKPGVQVEIRARQGRVRRDRRRLSSHETYPSQGGCLCGAVRYRISAEPIDAGDRHCRMCQRSTGAPVVSWLTMRNMGFAWTRGEP